MIWLSAEPDRAVRPSGLTASANTSPHGLSKGDPTISPVAMSHWISVPSLDADRARLPSGVNATHNRVVVQLLETTISVPAARVHSISVPLYRLRAAYCHRNCKPHWRRGFVAGILLDNAPRLIPGTQIASCAREVTSPAEPTELCRIRVLVGVEGHCLYTGSESETSH
jgi:hypothetical protein